MAPSKKKSNAKKETPKSNKRSPRVPSGRAANNKSINSMNLSSGASIRRPPVPLDYPTPSNSVTTIEFVPNYVNIGIFCDALTQTMLSRSNLSAQFNSQVYNEFRAMTVQVVLSAMRGDQVPPVSPLPHALAVVFFAFNTVKETSKLPNGVRLRFKVSAGTDATPPPQTTFGAPDLLQDANGFRKLPSYAPGSQDDILQSYRQIMGSTDEKLWSIGQPIPKMSTGTSQFATLIPDVVGGTPSYFGQNTAASSYVPLSCPVLAGLGLVQQSTGLNIKGSYVTQLYGNPGIYAGFFCTHMMTNPRDRFTIAQVDVEDFVVLVIGQMRGINDQAVKAGRPPIFTNECPVYLVAQILNVIATSQQKNFAITMNQVAGASRSIRAGTQFPPRDVTSGSAVIFHALVVEAMRRYGIISIRVPDEAYGGSQARLIMAPAFFVGPNIFDVAAQWLTAAGITVVPSAAAIEPTLWRDASDNTPLTYATSNATSSTPWESYTNTYKLKAGEIGNYSKQYPTTQQVETGLCLTHFFRLYVHAEQARVVLETAIMSSVGHDQKRLMRLRDRFNIKASASAGAAPLEPRPPWATATYALMTPNSTSFLNLPIPYMTIALANNGDIITSATAQVPGLKQLTGVNQVADYNLWQNLFLTGGQNVLSGTKDGATTELLQILENRAESGLGGALDEDIDNINSLTKGLYLTLAKNPSKKKYDQVAKPAVKLAKSLLRPVEATYNYMMN